MVSVHQDTFATFDLKTPRPYPVLRKNKTSGWQSHCPPGKQPEEFETGEMVINKRRVYPALLLTTYINRNHHFFLTRLMRGDKQSFWFGFNAARVPYHLVAPRPGGVGLQSPSSARHPKGYFCANTMAQWNPEDTSSVLFLHRTLAK